VVNGDSSDTESDGTYTIDDVEGLATPTSTPRMSLPATPSGLFIFSC